MAALLTMRSATKTIDQVPPLIDYATGVHNPRTPQAELSTKFLSDA